MSSVLTVGGRLKLRSSPAEEMKMVADSAHETLWSRLLLVAAFVVVLVWLAGLSWFVVSITPY